MTQPLTPFHPIFAVKSDGHDVVNQKGRVVRNGPTQEQLDRTPNDQGQCDFYRLIEKEDPKHMDWRKKLGGMLLRELAGKAQEDKWQQTILWDFPENYKLYEHIKTKPDGQAKTVKNHSGGGHDRQDAYLYGYPKGPRKRYRSPADFFPHLLWLCTDENSDYQNCTCKMCSPVQLEVEKPVVKSEVRSEVKAEPSVVVVKREPAMDPAAFSVAAVNPAVVIPSPLPRSVSGPPTQSPAVKPTTPATTVVANAAAAAPIAQPQNTPQIRPPAVLQSSPLPQPRGVEQLTDSRYGHFTCRTGEVVWFFRPKTSAWGLGLIVRRWTTRDSLGSKAYLIQPLSHPFDSVAPEIVTTDQHVKPWLAWSAPSCTFAYLKQNTQLRYDQVDWNALLSGQYGQGIADVDASIMAAKAIDTTYTLFERVKTTPITSGEERQYNGIYLGAEKIWRGDPVRIRLAEGTDLMVITNIIERVIGNPAQKQPGIQPASQVWATGDIYSYSTMSAPDPSKPPVPPSESNTNIPIRMREDMAWRNRMLVPMNQTLGWWRLISTSARVDMADVKGRWYETSLLFEDSFTEAVKKNEGGNGIWMNARGDATGIGRNIGLSRLDRVVAFGGALPKGTQITDGLDAPTPSIVQRSQQAPTSDLQALDIGVGTGGTDAFSLDDFMNVEHLEDGAGVDFSQDFRF
ncbi:transcription-silencing protein Clr2-domain-containing protein [Phaeosphaeriaceae sp. PMI808]|nr:transcription-silencing protein Clr2-domain-containing protein [Phaeosphaeriaceae sp. PMI808]